MGGGTCKPGEGAINSLHAWPPLRLVRSLVRHGGAADVLKTPPSPPLPSLLRTLLLSPHYFCYPLPPSSPPPLPTPHHAHALTSDSSPLP